MNNGFAALAEVLEDGEFLTSEPMSRHTTMKIGGPADYMALPHSVSQLEEIIKICKKENLPYFVIGNGSNLIVSDSGIEGLVIKTAKIEVPRDFDGKNRITLGAGEKLCAAAVYAKELGLSGLEFAYGIPGTVGGAVYMNAGAYCGEMADIVESVFAVDENTGKTVYNNHECSFSYRKSVFGTNRNIITSVTLSLKPGDSAKINAEMEKYMSSRRERQPLELPSAGSVFKRPKGFYAGALIEAAGLKGFSVGGMAVSEKHAGFIVNKGGATAGDFISLVELIKHRVYEKSGVKLECEVKFAGRFS